jgi:dTDP-4-dehydrorhamnose reductase
MRIAVIGAGQLSAALEAASVSVVPIRRKEGVLRADIRDRTAVRDALGRARPDAVILTAAATNVTWCEDNPAESREINVVGTQVVADEVAALGVRLVFLSSDYVFDGSSGPYRVGDEPSPINEYGRQKLAAEQIIRASSSSNVVVRTCQLFGPDSGRRNFVFHVADALRRDGVVTASRNMYGTPTYSPLLAHELLILAQATTKQEWHISGPDLVSRFELATRVAQAFGPENASVLASAGSPDDVPRPLRSGLVSDVTMPPLADSLRALAKLEQPTMTERQA